MIMTEYRCASLKDLEKAIGECHPELGTDMVEHLAKRIGYDTARINNEGVFIVRGVNGNSKETALYRNPNVPLADEPKPSYQKSDNGNGKSGIPPALAPYMQRKTSGEGKFFRDDKGNLHFGVYPRKPRSNKPDPTGEFKQKIFLMNAEKADSLQLQF